jgi:S-adenosylmethionine synthetase
MNRRANTTSMYPKNMFFTSESITEGHPDISMGISKKGKKIGAGDQGIMFSYNSIFEIYPDVYRALLMFQPKDGDL